MGPAGETGAGGSGIEPGIPTVLRVRTAFSANRQYKPSPVGGGEVSTPSAACSPPPNRAAALSQWDTWQHEALGRRGFPQHSSPHHGERPKVAAQRGRTDRAVAPEGDQAIHATTGQSPFDGPSDPLIPSGVAGH